MNIFIPLWAFALIGFCMVAILIVLCLELLLERYLRKTNLLISFAKFYLKEKEAKKAKTK